MKLPLSTLIFEGDDVATFLQGQFSADVNALDFIKPTAENCGLGAFCNRQGRAISLMWLIKKNDTLFHGILPTELAEKIQKHLTIFIFRSKVSITISDLNAEDKATLPTELIIPWITEANREKYVPQRLSLDILKGINFKKGCYTGQEIIARMQYLGSHRHRLCLVESEHLEDFSVNEPLLSEDAKEIGNIVYYKDNQALAVIQLEYKDSPIHIKQHPITLKHVWEE